MCARTASACEEHRVHCSTLRSGRTNDLLSGEPNQHSGRHVDMVVHRSYVCVQLIGWVSLVISEDSDLLVYGCPKVGTYYTQAGRCTHVDIVCVPSSMQVLYKYDESGRGRLIDLKDVPQARGFKALGRYSHGGTENACTRVRLTGAFCVCIVLFPFLSIHQICFSRCPSWLGATTSAAWIRSASRPPPNSQDNSRRTSQR